MLANTYQKYCVPLARAPQTKSFINWFISSVPATEPAVLLEHVTPEPQSLPPPLGQPVSEIICCFPVRPCVRMTSVFCQYDVVQDDA